MTLNTVSSRCSCPSPDVALAVAGLGKCYRLYRQPRDRLKQALYPRLRRLLPGLGRRPDIIFYDEFWALRDMTLTVRRGETLGILGRNGSGKSTLLQLIAGVLSPTTGSVEAGGRVAALLELGSGFNPEFSGRENVFLNAAVLGLEQEEIRRRYAAIVAFAELAAFMDQPLRTYSSGMVLRLAFAVAVNVEADILVVDEALAVGDEAFQRKCFARLQALRERGGTVLFVSHSSGAVLELCHRAVLLDRGELLLSGPPHAVVTAYQKLLYAPPAQVEPLRAALRRQVIADDAPPRESLPPPSPDRAWHDPGLVPRSTVRYASRGARLDDARITTPEGEPVNVLAMRGDYIFQYTVDFAQAAEGVRFGMLIKTTSGLELGGGVSATPTAALARVAAGSRLRVRFRFRCLLAPGTYFLNAGVTGRVDGVETFLDRCIDVAMFRVQPQPEALATGTVDFLVAPEISAS